MEKAIKRAIDGGFLPECQDRENIKIAIVQKTLDWNAYLLDKDFWQCLGKAEGWGEFIDIPCEVCGQMSCHNKIVNGDRVKKINLCKTYWHSFIDHISDGKDIDSYFEKILK